MYQQLEGFSASIRSPLAGEPGPPQELPDTLRGEAWQFVQLPLADLQSELQLAVQVRRESTQVLLGTGPALCGCSCVTCRPRSSGG